MNKILAIIKIEFQRQLTYRTDILMYVGGNFFSLVAQVIIWSSIFASEASFSNYTHPEIITYVVVGWVFSFVTASYNFENSIARDIHSGIISNFIIKPISYLYYMVVRSLGRIIIASSIIILQSIVYIAVFYDKIVFEMSLSKFFILLIMLIFAYLIKLYLAILVGFIAFWFSKVAGFNFALKTCIKFLSGAFFPISLLPEIFLTISLAFPFAYTFFVPAEVFLGKISEPEAIKGLFVQATWLVILYIAIKIVYKKGTREFDGRGM